jgi:hypothetical protein
VRLEKSRLQEQLALESESCSSMDRELCRLQNKSDRERQSSLEEEDEMEEEN